MHKNKSYSGWAVALLLVLFAAACMLGPLPAQAAGDWARVNDSGLADFTLEAVIAVSPSDVWAGGNNREGIEQLVQYNRETGETSKILISGLSQVYSLWAAGPDDLYAVGKKSTYGYIFKYNGETWSQVYKSARNKFLRGVWGNGPGDIYAVGNSGTIVHYDGTVWSATDSGSAETLYGVWGNGPGDIYAVGSSGAIVHYDGAEWSTMESGSASVLSGVWGSGPDDVYAVGYSGTIVHYDGTEWSAMESGTTSDLNGIWGSGPDDVYAVGRDGTILRYNGRTWSAMDSGTTGALAAVSGSGSEVYAVGYKFEGEVGYGVIYHHTVTADVPVTGVSLAPETLSLAAGQTYALTATVAPSEASERSVQWSSGDESVATVNAGGTVIAVSPGDTTIIVTTNDGGFTASCEVTVTEPEPPEALDGTLYLADQNAYFIVDTVLEPAGDLVLPFAPEIEGKEEWSALSLYIYDAENETIKEYPVTDGQLTLDEAFKGFLTGNALPSYVLSRPGLTCLDDMVNAGYYMMSFIVLPSNIEIRYQGAGVAEMGTLEVGYNENGYLSPNYLSFDADYEDESGNAQTCNDWRYLIDISSDNTDVVKSAGYCSVNILKKGEATISFSSLNNFWSGFNQITLTVEAAKDIDEQTIAVIDQIRALPASANIFDEASIAAVRAAYEALTEDQQAKVANYTKLQTLEEQLEALKASLAGDLVYALTYLAEGSAEHTPLAGIEGRAEWTGRDIDKSAQSVSLKAVVSEDVARVTVDGVEMTRGADGFYAITLNRPEDHEGVSLYKVDAYKEGSAEPDESMTVMLCWKGGYSVSEYSNVYRINYTQIRYFVGEPGNMEALSNGYLPNNTGWTSKYTSYKVANCVSDRVWIGYPVRWGSYTCDTEIIDPASGKVVSQRFGSVTPNTGTYGEPEAGEGIELQVGTNLLLIKMWPCDYDWELGLQRLTEIPTVIALYIDRMDDSLSMETGITSVAAVGDVGGEYEVTLDEDGYHVETLHNETGIKLIYKMPEIVDYGSSYAQVKSGYGDPRQLTAPENTVEDGVRTVVCHWSTYGRNMDFFTEYSATGNMVTRAEDGICLETFSVSFHRPASPTDGVTDSDLKTLTSSSGTLNYIKDGEQQQGFDPEVTEYSLELAANTAQFTLTAISKYATKGATLTVDGRFVNQVSGGNPGRSQEFPASVSMEQTIEIVVTPPKESTLEPKTYTVTVTKPDPSTGSPLVKNWTAFAGTANQLMEPDTSGSNPYQYVSQVKLTFTDDDSGENVFGGMLFAYEKITAAGTVDGACSALCMAPNIAMSSAPIKFSYTVNGGEKVSVPNARNSSTAVTAFNIPIPNEGENVIVVTLSDEAETITKTHTFRITKLPDATLAGISSDDAVFVGKFNPTMYRMNMLVEPGTGPISVTADASRDDAVVEFNGVTGTGSATAEGLVADTEYTITVACGGQSYQYYLVLKERQAFSASRVWAVMPAPGQFVNEHSQTVTGTMGAQGWGDGWDTTLYGATPEQAGKSNYARPGYSLGWFGGFLIYEFDEPILNSDKNKYGIDFTVYGNAFYGNSEPAGVKVSQDGETWYTLAGSKHYDPDTVWNYEVTYTNTSPDFDPYIAIDVPWKDNMGNGGLYAGNAYHPQPNYPMGVNYLFEGNHAADLYSAEELTLGGTKIMGFNSAYWGYADVHPNPVDNFDKPGNPYRAPSGRNGTKYAEGGDYGDGFDLSWAVDENGMPVKLDSVRYVKVYNSSMESHVGEVSPEITAIVRTTGESASVGTTEAPSITVNGRALALEDGVYTYEVPMSGTIEVSAALEGGMVWINNEYNGTLKEKDVADGRIVRVLAQAGESQPVIYYLTMVSTPAGAEDLAEVEEMIAAIGDVTLKKESLINAARAAYNALPPELRPQVSNYALLTAAETKLQELKGYPGGDAVETINVTFRLIGCTLADLEDAFDTIDLKDGDYKGAKYVTWITTSSYTMKRGDTVCDLFVKALNDAGLQSIGASTGYVSTIYAPSVCGGYALSEFTNGKRSGWMYTINGSHPLFGLTEQELNDGDMVIWHYVNDYAWEVEDWAALGGSGWPQMSTKDHNYWNKWLEAADVNPTSSGSSPGSLPGKTAGTTALTPAVTASGGKAAVNISASDLSDAIKSAKAKGSAAIVIAPAITGTANKVTIELSKTSLSSIASDTDANLTVQTPVGTVTLPNGVLNFIASQATGGTVSMSLESVEKSSLTPAQQETVGNKPVYDISIMSGSSHISSFDGKSITISLPYTLQKGETAADVKVWYLNDAGELEQVTCTYDEKTGLATFKTSHLSYYLVGVETAEKDDFTMSFTDVKEGDWFYEAVQYAVKNGLFVGTAPDTFNPNRPMTRAMLVTVLHRLEGSPAATGANNFTDVKNGEWYTNAVIWANANDVVSGYGNGLFGANDPVTREQVASILHRYASYKEYAVTAAANLSAYTDAADISSWAEKAMSWANAEGLITGRTTTTLASDGTATRAEVASILKRFVEGFVE